jgi:nicotinate-nucleotide--dimethylbenzimidazole phosphoribosyltransferase
VITLVLGGTRSGKSEHAEQLCAAGGDPVTYIATARPGDDADHEARIEVHRRRRPPEWTTLEPDDVVAALRAHAGTALLDSLGTWVLQWPDFGAPVADLCAALESRAGDSVVVSEEVGLGVHAPTELGRRFADAVGDANRAVAAIADRVVLVVAGRAVEL